RGQRSWRFSSSGGGAERVRATDRGRPSCPNRASHGQNLLNLRYQGPEQRSRKLPKALSRVQHSYGTTRRAITHATASNSALQRKVYYLRMPIHSGGKQRAF